MGLHSTDGEGSERLSVQVCEEAHWEAAAAEEIRELGLPASGGDTGGRGARGYTEINKTEAEYGCAIYCDAIDSGPMQESHS